MAQPPHAWLAGLGVCLAVVGAALSVACVSSSTGVCTPGGLGLPFFGFILLFGGLLSVGFGLLAYVTGSWDIPPGAYRAQAAGYSAYCPSCGRPLDWVGPAGRWYCHRCGAFR